MTDIEYKLKLNDIEKRFEEDKRILARDYAYSNNPNKIGDIVTDHIGSIKIERIKYTLGWVSMKELPFCVYEGIELKKDGTSTKKQNHRDVYQNNLIK
jgi:hypothetical protein